MSGDIKDSVPSKHTEWGENQDPDENNAPRDLNDCLPSDSNPDLGPSYLIGQKQEEIRPQTDSIPNTGSICPKGLKQEDNSICNSKRKSKNSREILEKLVTVENESRSNKEHCRFKCTCSRNSYTVPRKYGHRVRIIQCMGNSKIKKIIRYQQYRAYCRRCKRYFRVKVSDIYPRMEYSLEVYDTVLSLIREDVAIRAVMVHMFKHHSVCLSRGIINSWKCNKNLQGRIEKIKLEERKFPITLLML